MSPIKHVGLGTVGLVLSLAAATAWADVVAVVSSQSAIKTLSKSQVADIFLGKVRRFPDGTLAVPIDQAEDSAAREEFYTKVTGKSPAQLKAHWSKIIFTGRGQPPKSVPNGVEMKKRLAGDPTAIGYIEKSMLDGSVREVF